VSISFYKLKKVCMRTKALPGIKLENLLRPPLPPLVASPLPPLVHSPLPAPVLLELGRLDPLPARGLPTPTITALPSLSPLGMNVDVIARGVLELSQKQKNKSHADVFDARHVNPLCIVGDS
jgi:hypothetical protein